MTTKSEIFSVGASVLLWVFLLGYFCVLIGVFAWAFLRVSADCLLLAILLEIVEKSLPVRRQICYNFNNPFRVVLLRIGPPIPFLPPSHRSRGIKYLGTGILKWHL